MFQDASTWRYLQEEPVPPLPWLLMGTSQEERVGRKETLKAIQDPEAASDPSESEKEESEESRAGARK